MKIGILTFHRAYNYGAFLQSYALSTQLTKHGNDVEVIDFTPKSLMDSYKPIRLLESATIETNNPFRYRLKNIIYKLLNLGYIREKNSFDKIRNQYIWSDMDKLNLSSSCTISDDIGEFMNEVDNKYDLIIVGSEAIWNEYQSSCPFLYYLENVRCKYKASYAASAYGMSFEKLDKDHIARIKKALDEFNLISCRDDYTQNYISKIMHKGVNHTCDPTLFLTDEIFDNYAASAKTKLEKVGVDLSRKLVFLMGDNNIGNKLISVIGNEYIVVGMYNYNKYADVNVPNLSPFEWAAAFRFFDFTVTSYFHCSIFSLINHVPVIAVDKKTSFSIEHKSKIKDLFERLDEMDSYYTSDVTVSDLHNAVVKVQNRKEDSVWVNKQRNAIIKERISGEQYISSINNLA